MPKVDATKQQTVIKFGVMLPSQSLIVSYNHACQTHLANVWFRVGGSSPQIRFKDLQPVHASENSVAPSAELSPEEKRLACS